MGIKVAKFGGSSVADAIQINKIKNIVDADETRRYIIVSAPGKRFDNDSKVTDLLYSCMMHKEHNLPFDHLFQVIWDRFKALAMNLKVGGDIDREFEIIKESINKGTTHDYLASRGEYLNGKLIAEFLGMEFVDAAQVVKFDNRGKFLLEETNEALKERLKNIDKALIPGFYGAKPDGSIKTFSRGGSDITGALVARAVNAEVYENWTDVSGFLMADPRIIDNPEPIEFISYSELRELAYMGASVLHEDAIYPAKVGNIPINIRNTNLPDDKGTIISDDLSKCQSRVVTGIAGNKDFTVLAIFKNRLSQERGFIRRMAGILEDMDIPLEHMPSGIDTLSIVMQTSSIDGRIDELVERVENELKVDRVEVVDNIALGATVGSGMSSRLGVSAKLFTALAEAKINIRMIDQGSSEINIITGVENKDFERAVKAIYDAFHEEKISR